MQGWILYKQTNDLIKPEIWEVDRLVKAAGDAGIGISVINPDQVDIVVHRDDRKSILVDEVMSPLPDFVIPRMGSGTTYFALAVIRHLERLGVYSVNGSGSIETVKDKLYTLQILSEANLPIPKTMLVKFPVDTKMVQKHLEYPVIVKTLSGTQGSGVFLCPDRHSLDDLMQLIQTTNKQANIILQEFITFSKGRDLRVLIVGGRVIASMERIAGEGSFKANFSQGGKVKPFVITKETEWLVLEIARILDLDVAGIDLLFDKKGFKICEVNSAPGFEGLEGCCGVNIASEIINFTRMRCDKFKENR